MEQQGKWVYDPDTKRYRCSVCGDDQSAYNEKDMLVFGIICTACGAKME